MSGKLVSCLMVTKPDREAFRAQAIMDFVAQDYPERELVTIMDDGRSLGELRNEAVACANGDLLIQWDDDDRYDATRISAMVKGIGELDMCFLDTVSIKCRCGSVVISESRSWECSAIWRAAASAKYPPVEMAEDMRMFNAMRLAGASERRISNPLLYVKTLHGSNTSPGHVLVKRVGHACGE